VDKAIGTFVAELRRQGHLDSTLVIITAKHGQSPVDTARYTRITSTGAQTTAPSKIIDSCLPDSESNAGNQIGPTEDDVSLLWLKPGCSAESEVTALETTSPASHNIAGSARSSGAARSHRCSTLRDCRQRTRGLRTAEGTLR
jgi:arylsulfatase A-like enzyme